MKRQLFPIILICVSALGAGAQMTLNDCLKYAREHAHEIIIGRYDVDMAGADAGISASALMPYVSVGSSGQLSFGRNIDPETNTYANQRTLGASVGLSMSLPVFDGLVRINNLRAAKSGVSRHRKAFENQCDQIYLNVIRSFYNVSYCTKMVAQMEEQLLRDRTILSATERQEALGTKSGADVAEIRALVAADEYELTNQRNMLSKAYLQLRSDMGMALSDEPLKLAETEWRPGGVPGENPRVAEAAWAVRESLYNLRSARGAFFPAVSFNGGISTSYYKLLGTTQAFPRFSKQWHDNMGQYLGMSVTIPIFTGLSATNKLRRAKFAYRQQCERLEYVKYMVEKEGREARMDYMAAIEELASAQARLDAEQMAFASVARKYELGGMSAIDYYTASSKLATARAALEGKRIQKIVSYIVLEYYNGEKLIKD